MLSCGDLLISSENENWLKSAPKALCCWLQRGWIFSFTSDDPLCWKADSPLCQPHRPLFQILCPTKCFILAVSLSFALLLQKGHSSSPQKEGSWGHLGRMPRASFFCFCTTVTFLLCNLTKAITDDVLCSKIKLDEAKVLVIGPEDISGLQQTTWILHTVFHRPYRSLVHVSHLIPWRAVKLSIKCPALIPNPLPWQPDFVFSLRRWIELARSLSWHPVSRGWRKETLE